MISHPNRLTPAEYLQWEARQQMRHEYINGGIFAMTGGSVSHNMLTLNMARTLADHIEPNNSPCRVFISLIDGHAVVTRLVPSGRPIPGSPSGRKPQRSTFVPWQK